MNLIDLRYVSDIDKINIDNIDIMAPAPSYEPNRQMYFMAKVRNYIKKKSDELKRPLCFFTQTFGCPNV